MKKSPGRKETARSMEKIKITIEGIEEKPVLLEVDGFALVTFTDDVIKQRTYGLRISELVTASNVLQTVCIREMLSQEKSKLKK